jgi:hypothetical protein
MDFRALPPQRPLDIGRGHAGPHTAAGHNAPYCGLTPADAYADFNRPYEARATVDRSLKPGHWARGASSFDLTRLKKAPIAIEAVGSIEVLSARGFRISTQGGPGADMGELSCYSLPNKFAMLDHVFPGAR